MCCVFFFIRCATQVNVNLKLSRSNIYIYCTWLLFLSLNSHKKIWNKESLYLPLAEPKLALNLVFGILTMVDNFLFLTFALMRQVKSVDSGCGLSEPGLGFALSTPSSESRKLHKFYMLIPDMRTWYGTCQDNHKFI